jgi:hypothetical protein
MVQGVCPGRSERFFRDKQSRRVGGNGEVGEKRGMRRRRETRKEKTGRNAEGEDGKKLGRRSRRETRKEKTERNAGGGKEKKHSEKEIRSRSHDRLRTNYNPIINN